jgi:hypothetical protein
MCMKVMRGRKNQLLKVFGTSINKQMPLLFLCPSFEVILKRTTFLVPEDFQQKCHKVSQCVKKNSFLLDF